MVGSNIRHRAIYAALATWVRVHGAGSWGEQHTVLYCPTPLEACTKPAATSSLATSSSELSAPSPPVIWERLRFFIVQAKALGCESVGRVHTQHSGWCCSANHRCATLQ